jgi:hypothetical protein
MIVVRQQSRLRIVTQSDHARLAGEILALWREDGLPEHPRRTDLLFATREHDNGWRGVDAAPRVDRDTGRPFSFRNLPPAARVEVWLQGTERFREEAPWAAALIVEHALALHRNRGDDPDLGLLLERLEEEREVLLAACGLDEAELAGDYRYLAAGDTLSLAASEDWDEPVEVLGRTGRMIGDTLEIVPFPLAGATSFTLPCRWIEDRPYSDDTDLAVTLAAATWQRTRVRVAPG